MSVPIAPKSAASPSQPADETPAVGHTHRGVQFPQTHPLAVAPVTAPPNTVDGFVREFLHELNTDLGVALSRSSINDQYTALAHTVRNYLTARWLETMRRNRELQPKTVAYLSAEYLLGRHLGNNLLAANLNDIAAKALNGCGLSLDTLRAQEGEPGLGNGGLGRLAA
ncbi:MAG TPA: glycogen/starch/alpha-glucan phosphorylase, partial [Micropruina sp.]|nr:glycogen/starch/alpha-glucan phosphorylase [Micropruina sp.]